MASARPYAKAKEELCVFGKRFGQVGREEERLVAQQRHAGQFHSEAQVALVDALCEAEGVHCDANGERFASGAFGKRPIGDDVHAHALVVEAIVAKAVRRRSIGRRRSDRVRGRVIGEVLTLAQSG